MRALQVQENDPDYLEPQSFTTHAWEWGKLFLEIVILSDRSWNKKTGCCLPDATTSKENVEVMLSAGQSRKLR